MHNDPSPIRVLYVLNMPNRGTKNILSTVPLERLNKHLHKRSACHEITNHGSNVRPIRQGMLLLLRNKRSQEAVHFVRPIHFPRTHHILHDNRRLNPLTRLKSFPHLHQIYRALSVIPINGSGTLGPAGPPRGPLLGPGCSDPHPYGIGGIRIHYNLYICMQKGT